MQVGEICKITSNKFVKVSKQGNKYLDVTFTELKPKSNIKKLNKNEYIKLSTGEIKKFNYTKNKSIDSLIKTIKHIREIIRCNFNGDKNEIFLTLTYKENMQDTDKLYNDFKKFFQKLKRKFKDYNFEYIAVAEPQERGAWHLHILLKAENQKSLFLQQEMLLKMWGYGGVFVERIKNNVDDLGTYLGTYFTDLLNENSKQRKKGARLHLYPKGFKFYRTSRGIKKPEVFYTQYKNIEEQGYKKTYTKTYELIEEKIIENEKGEKKKERRICNVIQKEVWKK